MLQLLSGHQITSRRDDDGDIGSVQGGFAAVRPGSKRYRLLPTLRRLSDRGDNAARGRGVLQEGGRREVRRKDRLDDKRRSPAQHRWRTALGGATRPFR